jgi:hypothetical protein
MDMNNITMDLETVVFNVSKFKGKIDGNNIDSAKIVILSNEFNPSDNVNNAEQTNIRKGYEVSIYKMDPRAFDDLEAKHPLLKFPVKCKLKVALKNGKPLIVGFHDKFDAVKVG